MPTYEYACSSCDTTHEVQQKMSDPTLTDCPSCGESGLRKLFSGVGIHFKGSGFYRTDSRDAKSSSSPSSASTSTSDGSKSTDTKTSSTPASSGGSSSSSSSGGSTSSSSTPAASTSS